MMIGRIVTRFASRLRYPTLFKVVGGAVPARSHRAGLHPVCDEILLGARDAAACRVQAPEWFTVSGRGFQLTPIGTTGRQDRGANAAQSRGPARRGPFFLCARQGALIWRWKSSTYPTRGSVSGRQGCSG